MFIDGNGWYDGDGCQCSRGSFLVVCQDPESKALRPELRAILRSVILKQFGPWMMGQTKVCGHEIVLSGAYGSDGLPIHLPHKNLDPDSVSKIWEMLHPIPDNLQTAFWEGGGHNTCGSEAPLMKEWGLKNINVLKRERKP